MNMFMVLGALHLVAGILISREEKQKFDNDAKSVPKSNQGGIQKTESDSEIETEKAVENVDDEKNVNNLDN